MAGAAGQGRRSQGGAASVRGDEAHRKGGPHVGPGERQQLSVRGPRRLQPRAPPPAPPVRRRRAERGTAAVLRPAARTRRGSGRRAPRPASPGPRGPRATSCAPVPSAFTTASEVRPSLRTPKATRRPSRGRRGGAEEARSGHAPQLRRPVSLEPPHRVPRFPGGDVEERAAPEPGRFPVEGGERDARGRRHVEPRPADAQAPEGRPGDGAGGDEPPAVGAGGERRVAVQRRAQPLPRAGPEIQAAD